MSLQALNSLTLTLLPNGVSGENARASVLVTFSDNPNADLSFLDTWLSGPQQGWVASQLREAIQQSGLLLPDQRTVVPWHLDPASSELNENLWATLLAKNPPRHKEGVQRRIDIATTKAAARKISHDAATLHYMHLAQRRKHVLAQFAEQRSTRSRKPMDASLRRATTQYLNQQQQLVNLYLHPWTRAAGTSPQVVSMTELIQRRKQGLAFLTTTIAGVDPNTLKEWQERVQQSQGVLERGGDQLLDIALYAIYLVCADSIASFKDAGTLRTAIIKQATDLVTTNPLGSEINPEMLDQARLYVEYLLHTRPVDENQMQAANKGHRQGKDTLEPPTFHQLLGLIHRTPALLRPLGLVFDFVFDPKALLPLQGQPPGTLVIACGAVGTPQLWTQCTLEWNADKTLKHFYASPSQSSAVVPLINNRLVRLGYVDSDMGINGASFSLISTDVENDTKDRIRDSTAKSRSAEYTSSANTAPAPDGSAPDPEQSLLPLNASRTAGVALLHSQRTDRLQNALDRAQC